MEETPNGWSQAKGTNQSGPGHGRLWTEPQFLWEDYWTFMTDFLTQSSMVSSYPVLHLPHSHATHFRKWIQFFSWNICLAGCFDSMSGRHWEGMVGEAKWMWALLLWKVEASFFSLELCLSSLQRDWGWGLEGKGECGLLRASMGSLRFKFFPLAAATQSSPWFNLHSHFSNKISAWEGVNRAGELGNGEITYFNWIPTCGKRVLDRYERKRQETEVWPLLLYF